MFNFNFNTKVLCSITAIVAVILIGLYGYKHAYDKGYEKGNKDGYECGYAAALDIVPAPKPDTVQAGVAVVTKTETTVRPKTQAEIANNAPSVVVTTEAPKVTASVNGKKYDFEPKTEVLQTGVKTTATISVKVPERRWKIGLGIDNDKEPAYMLTGPIKGAVGFWVAGSGIHSGKHKVMGGVSISF